MAVPRREPLHIAIPDAWSAGGNDTPSAAQAAAQSDTLSAGWERFGDPWIVRLVARAAESNTEVRGAQARLRQARALRDETASTARLQLTSSASVQHSRSDTSSTVFRAGLDASWELDLFGATRHAVAASESDLQASAAALGATQTSIAAEVVLAYAQLRGQQARLAIARDSQASQQQVLQLAQWRRQAGLASALDVEQARAALAQVQAQQPALAASIAQARRSLDVLCGQLPAAWQAELARPLPLPVLPADMAPAPPAETLTRRPDVQAAGARVDAAAARAAQARAERWPSVPLSASVLWSALGLRALGNPGRTVSALASARLPWLDGGAQAARQLSQDAQLEAAAVAYQATVLQALQEVEDVLADLAAARERLVALRSAARAAGQAAELAALRYASGTADFLGVLDTQRTLLAAQDALAATQTDLMRDQVRLYKALGGGWQPPVDSSSPAASPSPAASTPPAAGAAS